MYYNIINLSKNDQVTFYIECECLWMLEKSESISGHERYFSFWEWIFFCGDVPQWPPLIGSHYVDHYYATQPTVICLHQSLIMVFNIALRIVITTLQIYKSINENIFQLLISRFFKLASPCSYSQSIVTFVLLWIPLLLVLNFFILAFLRFLWILLLNICPTAFVGRSSWRSIRQYLPWAANNSKHILG